MGEQVLGAPGEDPSYVGFLLDAAHHSGLTAAPRYLSRLARSGVEGCDFIIELAGLGTALPDETLHSTANRLYRLAHNTFREGDDPRAADLLYALAHDTALDRRYRVQAAESQVGLGDPRAAYTVSLLR